MGRHSTGDARPAEYVDAITSFVAALDSAESGCDTRACKPSWVASFAVQRTDECLGVQLVGAASCTCVVARDGDLLIPEEWLSRYGGLRQSLILACRSTRSRC